MSLLVRVLVACLACLGLTASAVAVTAPTASAIPEFAYDVTAPCPPASKATTTRGPPTTTNDYTAAQHAVDNLPAGVSPCLASAVDLDPSKVVQLTLPPPTTQRQVQVADAQLADLDRAGVAAKTESTLARTCLRQFSPRHAGVDGRRVEEAH
jgi:hypothetical protein